MQSDDLSKTYYHDGEKELSEFKGFTYDNVAQKYNVLAEKYEPALGSMDFPDPELCANKIEEISENKDVEILDIGAGTGFVGEELVKLGFKNITAIDGSASMLKIAREKNVYQNLHEVFLGIPGKFPVEFHGKYDFVTASAVFAAGHVRDTAFDDILIALKSDGYAIVTIAEDHLSAYERKINMFIEQKKWELKTKKTYEKFTKLKGLTGSAKTRTAHMYVFKRLFF